MLEDPTYRNVVEARKATGNEVRFLRYENLRGYCHLPKADAIFVTLSKQFRLGDAIDMPQHFNLPGWAKENQNFIVENDCAKTKFLLVIAASRLIFTKKQVKTFLTSSINFMKNKNF